MSISQASRDMDEEMNSLAAAAAAAAVTSMTTDLWQAMRSALVRIFRRHPHGPGVGEPLCAPVRDSRQAILRQENIARDDGTVFAVQSGELHVHGPRPAL